MGDFISWELKHGCLADLEEDEFPTTLWGWKEQELALEEGSTHFGLVHAGTALLRCASGSFSLMAGMYFAVPGSMRIVQGTGIVVTRRGFQGLFHLGGPVEAKGRLHYIDGCTDSLLVPPVLKGDPCLNLLHIPPHTRQTAHTHPSVRVGLVIRGHGWCVTPAGRLPLEPGRAFVIRARALHSFHTDDEDLGVIAYHPDSDFGPTHEDHPMVNRTLISQ
jgi:hypothetical protein